LKANAGKLFINRNGTYFCKKNAGPCLNLVKLEFPTPENNSGRKIKEKKTFLRPKGKCEVANKNLDECLSYECCAFLIPSFWPIFDLNH